MSSILYFLLKPANATDHLSAIEKSNPEMLCYFVDTGFESQEKTISNNALKNYEEIEINVAVSSSSGLYHSDVVTAFKDAAGNVWINEDAYEGVFA